MNHGHTRARTPGRLTHWEDTWACITWSSSTEVAWKHPPCARHRHTTDRSHKGRVREERNPSTKKAQQPQKQQKPQETIRCSQREGEKKLSKLLWRALCHCSADQDRIPPPPKSEFRYPATLPARDKVEKLVSHDWQDRLTAHVHLEGLCPCASPTAPPSPTFPAPRSF